MNSYEDLAMMLGKEEMLADAFKDCLLSHLKKIEKSTKQMLDTLLHLWYDRKCTIVVWQAHYPYLIYSIPQFCRKDKE